VAGDADVVARDVRAGADGGHFTLRTADRGGVPLHTPLLGPLNVANALAAAVTARLVGFDDVALAAGLASVAAIPGRLERVDAGQPFTVLVDYAHTPDALRAALVAARQLAGPRRVLVVFGAGGERDAAKRPLMGRAAAVGADVVVVTDDNPRSEDPAEIAAALVAGAADGPGVVRREPDRRSAIRSALEEARRGDVVLIAGKGHETEQRVGDRAIPFDDRVVAREELGAGRWN
jgi:UDP-N-acetylmuramoyl-L-alanyl-D-glutamate--2,6-diaminopimelate ligase